MKDIKYDGAPSTYEYPSVRPTVSVDSPTNFLHEHTTSNYPDDTISSLFVDNNPLKQLTESVAQIANALNVFSQPLLRFLEEKSPSKQVQTNLPTDKILSTSPIESLLKDDTISDILINGPSEIYIIRKGMTEKTDITFPNHQSLKIFATAITQACGRIIDPNRPFVDARLEDGSRINIIAPPMAVKGIAISIRKFPKEAITLESLIENHTITPQVAEFLKLCAKSKANIIISGGTGTGKTTLLNAISQYIPNHERIITIEDTAELRLQQPHVVQLETKEPSFIGERREEVNTSDLVRNALRMRPDRIIVGEVRGTEAYDMIQAMNTGHNGSMATVHANTPRDAFTRLENLLSPVMANTTAINIRRQMVSALHIIIQLAHSKDGRRIVSSIAEVVGMEGETPTMQEIFVLKEDNNTPGKKIYIQSWTKIVPHHPKLAELVRKDSSFISNSK
jgi:pilus assembly protein CpaF